MAKPTQKNKDIDNFLKKMGFDRIGAITNDICVICNGKADSFKDKLSERAYEIGGMCQGCQDKIFDDD